MPAAPRTEPSRRSPPRRAAHKAAPRPGGPHRGVRAGNERGPQHYLHPQPPSRPRPTPGAEGGGGAWGRGTGTERGSPRCTRPSAVPAIQRPRRRLHPTHPGPSPSPAGGAGREREASLDHRPARRTRSTSRNGVLCRRLDISGAQPSPAGVSSTNQRAPLSLTRTSVGPERGKEAGR